MVPTQTAAGPPHQRGGPDRPDHFVARAECGNGAAVERQDPVGAFQHRGAVRHDQDGRLELLQTAQRIDERPVPASSIFAFGSSSTTNAGSP